MEQQVKVETVEVIEEKKGWFTKKKLIAIGVGVATLVVGGVALALRGKGDSEESNDQIVEAEYESVNSSDDVSAE
jgi:hypothetical protein